MAARIRGLGRLLVALTLMGWGHLAFAEDYYWILMTLTGHEYNPSKSSSPSGACAYAPSLYNPDNPGAYTTRLVSPSETAFVCQVWSDRNVRVASYGVQRKGSGCTPPAVYNAETYSCESPFPPDPTDCEPTAGQQITKAQTCSYSASLKTYICDDQIEFEGCLYTGGAGRKCVASLVTGQGVCTGDFYGSGQPAGNGPDSCTEESCTPPRDPNVPPAEEQCVTNGDLTICYKPQDEGCGTVNGKEGCFQEKPGCGYYNGTYGCYSADKPQRNCTYFNGKLTCTKPNDPTKPIDESSPDHPNNGGNADGNENNDPKAPGDTNGNPQGSDEAATNEAIDKLGDKIGEGNDLLGDIKGVLEGIADGIEALTEALLGDEYDGSGDGNGDDMEGLGSGIGNDLAGMLGEQLEGAQAEQLVADELNLDQIVDDVDSDKWFGDNSQVAGLLDFARDLLPAATSCNDVTVTFNLGRYNTRLVLPVCDLAALKPLLEWIIYVVTAIGLWNITYATLRMENAKAAKGGF